MTITDEQIEKAEAQFTEWFVKNYPGPDTIIGKPEWHSPRIFSRARAALEAVMPEGEPVAWGAAYGGKIATISLTKTRHHTAPLYAHPAPEQGELERLREAHRENIRLLGHVAHDLTGRVESGKVAAIYTAINNARAALEEEPGELERAALEAVPPEGNQNGPDWEGFGRAVMADWPEGGGIDGFTLQDMAAEHGLLREVPGGFNPEEHIDVTCCAEPGDVWFEVTFPSNRDGNRKPAPEQGELDRLREAARKARAVLAQAASAGWNSGGPTPEDTEAAFWSLDAALAEGGRDE